MANRGYCKSNKDREGLQEPIVSEQEDNPTEVKERIIHLRLRRRNKRSETNVTGLDDLIEEDEKLLPRLRKALCCNCAMSTDPDTQQQYLRKYLNPQSWCTVINAFSF